MWCFAIIQPGDEVEVGCWKTVLGATNVVKSLIKQRELSVRKFYVFDHHEVPLA